MGTGGYRSKEPVWVAMERQMLEQGITPETAEWDRRWKNYVLGHGGTYDMETGKLIAKKEQMVEPLAELRTAIKDSQEGRFKPERERRADQSPRESRKRWTNTRLWS